MTTVVNGALGGLLAGLLAASAMRFVHRRGRRRRGEGTDDEGGGRTARRPWREVLRRSVYGGLAGGGLVALVPFGGGLGVPVPPGVAVSVGVGWGATLLVVAVAVRRILPGRPIDRAALEDLVGFHLAYGLGLGLWIRLTWIT